MDQEPSTRPVQGDDFHMAFVGNCSTVSDDMLTLRETFVVLPLVLGFSGFLTQGLGTLIGEGGALVDGEEESWAGLSMGTEVGEA